MSDQVSHLTLDALNHDTVLTDLYRRLLFLRCARIHADSDDFWVFAGKLSYSANVASSDLLMRAGFQRGFALDEGMFQMFPDEFIALGPDDRYRFCAGRYLVLLSARDPDTIARRAIGRHEDRLRRGHFQHPTTLDRQRERAIKAVSLYTKVAESAEDCGVEVLRLFAEDETFENRQAFLAFSRRISCAETQE